jgi:hypothetical protein
MHAVDNPEHGWAAHWWHPCTLMLSYSFCLPRRAEAQMRAAARSGPPGVSGLGWLTGGSSPARNHREAWALGPDSCVYHQEIRHADRAN